MNDDYIVQPDEFALEVFALNNKALFDGFIECTVRGVDKHVAFRLVFGDEFLSDSLGNARIYGVLRNPYYKKRFEARLAEIPLAELWNPRIAIHQLISIVRDEMNKASARINAIRELNVMTGITVIDEAGNTKMGRSLDDFYAVQAENQADLHYQPGGDSSTKH